MITRGNYHFDNLPPIYVISILAGKTYKTKKYHQIGTLRNQHGEEIDNQITHVIVELGKFNLSRDEVKTDLDKLPYTMKTTDQVSVLEPFNPPEFWDEEWMKADVEELNLRAMTPQERFAYQKALIKYRMAAQITEDLEREAVEAQQEAKRAREEIRQRKLEAIKAQQEAVTKMLASGLLTDEQIAEFQNVPLSRVQEIKNSL